MTPEALALEAALDGTPGVLVRTVTTIGFGTRPPIEATVILTDGRRAGQILNGRLDHALDDTVRDLADPNIATRVGITSVADDQGCGGTAEVLIQPITQLPDRYWVPSDPPDVAVTLLDHDIGTTVIVTADRTIIGTLGHADLDRRAINDAALLLRAARATTTITQLTPDHRALFEVRRRTATLVIAGVSELADATATIATTLGWIVRCSADADTACRHLDHCTDGDALIVMSHDPSLDEPVLVRAATAPLGYIGVLGSRRIHTQRHARLRRRGLDDTFIARLRGPAGLDIGAWTPQETAISLMAEIIALRGGRTGRPLTDIPDRIHH